MINGTMNVPAWLDATTAGIAMPPHTVQHPHHQQPPQQQPQAVYPQDPSTMSPALPPTTHDFYGSMQHQQHHEHATKRRRLDTTVADNLPTTQDPLQTPFTPYNTGIPMPTANAFAPQLPNFVNAMSNPFVAHYASDGMSAATVDPQSQPQPSLNHVHNTNLQLASLPETQQTSLSLTAPGICGYSQDTSDASPDALAALPTPQSNDPEYYSSDPSVHLKIQELPMLDSLATQVISTLAKNNFNDIVQQHHDAHSENFQAFNTQKALFNHTKRVFERGRLFLDARAMNLMDPSHQDIIRRANIASFLLQIFEFDEDLYEELDSAFLTIFVPYGSRLLKWQAALYLDLKTQAYISALARHDTGRREVVERVFPLDMDVRLLSRRMGAKQLAPSEVDFINRCFTRRRYLENELDPLVLGKRYSRNEFLKNVSSIITRNVAALCAPDRHVGTNGDSSDITKAEPSSPIPNNSIPLKDTPHLENPQPLMAPSPLVAQGGRAWVSMTSDIQWGYEPVDYQAYPHNQHRPVLYPNAYEPQQPLHSETRWTSTLMHPTTATAMHQQQQHMVDPTGLPPQLPLPQVQDESTFAQYERARQATATTTTKPSQPARRGSMSSQRRPWSTEEERALMDGLDYVRGPHWSQILALYGPGGNVNEILKDRNQVQLKDKARNLKLFFLKSGFDVPFYLQSVTGELKSRTGRKGVQYDDAASITRTTAGAGDDERRSALTAGAAERIYKPAREVLRRPSSGSKSNSS